MVLEVLTLEKYADTLLLIARLIVGVTMIYYGWPKIKDLKSNANDFEGMGFKPGILWGTIVAGVEFIGGIALLLGAFTPIIAIAFGFQMGVGTIWKITKTNKQFKDWSYDLLLLALMLVFLTFGPGAYSIPLTF